MLVWSVHPLPNGVAAGLRVGSLTSAGCDFLYLCCCSLYERVRARMTRSGGAGDRPSTKTPASTHESGDASLFSPQDSRVRTSRRPSSAPLGFLPGSASLLTCPCFFHPFASALSCLIG
ncbi:hypothetical protein HDV57DRAFT_51286 [Trichoderma longibrachiatum]